MYCYEIYEIIRATATRDYSRPAAYTVYVLNSCPFTACGVRVLLY